MSVSVRESIITPDLAREILLNNKRNRPISAYWVSELAKRMKRGEWKFNGDAIRMNGDLLIDGQHRLKAILESGVSVKTLVIEGLDDSVFDTIDGGRRRSGSDTLAVRGEKNTTCLAAALVVVHMCKEGSWSASHTPSNTIIERLLEKYPGVRNSVNWLAAKKKVGLAPQSLVAAMHFLFYEKDPDAADVFIYDVMTGLNLDSDDPAHVLRERLIRNLSSKAKLNRQYIAALFIKAWNHRRAGKKTKTLKYTSEGDAIESFPVPI